LNCCLLKSSDLGSSLSSLREKSAVHLILGGAAVHHCDKRLAFSGGFSHCGQAARSKTLFPQAVEPLMSLTARSPHQQRGLRE